MAEIFGWGGGDQKEKLGARVARLERMLQAIMDRLEIDYDDNAAIRKQVSQAVLANIQSGNTIAAIKLYRHETGASLAEAKQLMDQLAAQGTSNWGTSK
ncbi:MAG: hypothetical protein AAF351_08290 [Pseudomonadota bacterium]